MSALTVDLFTDIVCPWCFIGVERLEKVVQALPPEHTVTIVHHPFLLDADVPEQGVDIAAMLKQKYGASPESMFSRVEAAAAESGLSLDLRKQPTMYPTTKAHTLLRHAAAKGTQHALARALFKANFQDGENIADVAVLTRLGEAHGFSADEVARVLGDTSELDTTRSQAQEASRGGIRGVPFYVFDGRLAVSGAQPEAALREVIDEVVGR